LAENNPTYPHDYRLIADSDVRPTIVGGHAINIWAIAYLLPENPAIDRSQFASGDLDVVANPAVLGFLKDLPGWKFEKIPWSNWADQRAAKVHGVAADGRRLLVEVLTKVHGLEKADLEAVAEVTLQGVRYAPLDPIAMLKAKAANVRDLDQVGPPPRHDRQHLQLIARCWPRYLRELHANAVQEPSRAPATARIFSRAFDTLIHAAKILRAEGIAPENVMPAELAQSPIDKIRNAYKWQALRITGSQRPGQRQTI
jgi:hypothetical protein